MNSVSYAFCEAVCGVLREIREMNKLCDGNGTNYAIWNRAAKRTREERLDVRIYIDFRSKTWTYKITICEEGQNIGRTLLFQDFRKLNRQHVLMTAVQIGYRNFGNSTYRASTLEEIVEIFKFIAPCVNLSVMAISEIAVSEDDLSRLLSFYQNATFRHISCYSPNRASEQFLIAQMQTSALESFSIEGDGWTEELRSAIEEFALNKDFERISVLSPSLVFGRAFFDALIQKPLFRKQWTFDAQFSFEARELATSGFQEIGGRYVSHGMRSNRQVGVLIPKFRMIEYLTITLEPPM